MYAYKYKKSHIYFTYSVNQSYSYGWVSQIIFLSKSVCLLLESNQVTEISSKVEDNLNKTSTPIEDYDKISVSIYRNQQYDHIWKNAFIINYNKVLEFKAA